MVYMRVVGARMCSLCFVPRTRNGKQEIATLPVHFCDMHHAIGIEVTEDLEDVE